jgi:glycosyltransferase involved in cell wall biosynthesis
MTAYNREQYLGEAIESVLNSDYPNIELIIVDDKSTDDTVEIAKKYSQQNVCVKLYINEVNLGDYGNRNRAAEFATGYYLMHVDSDDTIYKEAISNSVNAMQRFPEANFGMCHLSEAVPPFYLNAKEALQKHFFKKPFLYLGPGGTIVKRKFFNEAGKFPVKYGPANDMYFNLKMVSYAGVLMLPFRIIFYRRHDGQEINNQYVYLYQNYNYLRDALTELPLSLTAKQIQWLSNKNKRRFLVNLIGFYFRSFDAKKTAFAIRQTGFRLVDVSKAIFQN